MHEIEVTREDIESGVQFKCSRCPIARAADRHFSKRVHAYHGVSVDGEKVHMFQQSQIPGKITMLIYRMPASAMGFVELYDAGKRVSPFKFKIEYEDYALIDKPTTV